MNSLFVWLQYLLPRHALTALVWRIARIRNRPVKNALIRAFVRLYEVNTEEVERPVPDGFASFNEFFVRELKPGRRPLDGGSSQLISPVDGTLSAAGRLRDGRLIQAKGIDYSLEDLLATNLDDAKALDDGSFATIYLAPYNYHRVHAPFAGRLARARYVPGDLFSVNAATVARLSGLFHRNERLILRFATEFGTAFVVLVGALNVGSISTPWGGEIRPRKSGVVEQLAIPNEAEAVARGDLLGWFNMGSTVILLLPPGDATLDAGLAHGATLRTGQAIGTFGSTPA